MTAPRTTNTTQLYKKVGRRYVPVPDQIDSNTGFMAGCGLRYCLGRASYAPGTAMHWCRGNWSRLDDRMRFVAVRDVIEWLADRALWDTPGAAYMQDGYRAEWQAFALEMLGRESEDFAQRIVRAALYSPEKCKAPEVAPFLRYLA